MTPCGLRACSRARFRAFVAGLESPTVNVVRICEPPMTEYYAGGKRRAAIQHHFDPASGAESPARWAYFIEGGPE